tara:strand:- start:232 stop:918 length:687 start_codon:yes stop_codon:yes gene_type:complete
MMHDVSLYGHITVDRIFDDFNESLCLGAVVNSWSALMQIDPHLKVKLNPASYGEAIILVDKQKNFRLGQPQLNIKINKSLNAVESRWHHLMYLNSLPDVSFLNNIKSGIISADITVGNKNRNLEFLNLLDFLFISDEDLFMDLNDLARRVKGWTILHSQSGSVCTNGVEFYEQKTSVVDGLNVLGAGDIFASAFISSSLQNLENINDNIKFAHKKTLDLLLKKQLEEY